jgi:hypothetical protein
VILSELAAFFYLSSNGSWFWGQFVVFFVIFFIIALWQFYAMATVQDVSKYAL